MDLTLNLVVGTATGIITSAILLLLSTIFKRIVMPWYQEVTYKGADIAGIWVQEYSSPEFLVTFSMNLKQSAHTLTGTLHFKRKTGDSEKEIEFHAEGKLWEGYAIINLSPSDRRKISYATTLLKVCYGGNRLKGNFSFRGFDSDVVESNELELKRSGA